MARPAPPDDAARRRRRAADTAAWRSRQRRGVQLFQDEAGAWEYGLMLREGRTSDKRAVRDALGRLLRKALAALVLHEETTRRR
ncbi:MAG: hypothetical protein ACM3IH_20625 [Sphingobacteriales bacterium]|jgi:hypothetical protein